MDVDPPSDEHGAPDDAMAAEVQMSSSFQEDYEYTVSSRPVLKTPEDALAYWNLSLERVSHSQNKTWVINDPLSQTHSLASSEHFLFCFKRTDADVCTDDMCENNVTYRQ